MSSIKTRFNAQSSLTLGGGAKTAANMRLVAWPRVCGRARPTRLKAEKWSTRTETELESTWHWSPRWSPREPCRATFFHSDGWPIGKVVTCYSIWCPWISYYEASTDHLPKSAIYFSQKRLNNGWRDSFSIPATQRTLQALCRIQLLFTFPRHAGTQAHRRIVHYSDKSTAQRGK